MTKPFLSKKNFSDLDLGFVFDRLQVVTPYGEQAKNAIRAYRSDEMMKLSHEFDLTDRVMERLENKRYDLLDLKALFKEIKQLGSTFDRIEAQETLSVTELFEIKHLTLYMQKIMDLMETIKWRETVGDYMLDPVTPVIELLDPEKTGVSTFYIYNSYSQKLAQIRDRLAETEIEIKRQSDFIGNSLTEEGYKVNANGEVRIQQMHIDRIQAAKQHPLLSYRMDIPLYSIFRVKPDSRLEKTRDQLLIEQENEEFEVRTHLTRKLLKQLQLLRNNTERIGNIDLLIAKGQFAMAFHCIRPEFLKRTHEAGKEEEILEIKGGRHLKVSYGLERTGKVFTPVDIKIHRSVTLITGANMGGKTVSLRMIGQMVALAHMGMHVPCKSFTLYPLDFLFISVGDSQSIDMGLSTFGAEIVEIGEVIRRRDEHGMILIDELARGTNPKEGFAISKAVIEHMKPGNAKTIITTHYDGLTQSKGVSHYQVNGLANIDFERIRKEIQSKGMGLLHEHMDYRLTEVSGDTEIPKEALRISEMMGLDQGIIERAKAILGGSNDE